VEERTVAGLDVLNLAGSGSRGGVSGPKVLLALSSGQISVGDDPQSLPSRGNDISMASDEPRVATPVDFSLSYQPNLIWDMLFTGWQCENDRATLASFCPIRLETPSPDASEASIVSLVDADVLLLR
jgi:hypothetical protein